MEQRQIDQLLKRATRALNSGDYPGLQRLSKQILSLDRKQADAWFFMSLVAEAGRQPGHALQFVERALEITPTHVEYLTQKAKLHSLLNNYSQTKACADRATRTGPERALVLDTLGVIYTRLGEFEKACDLLKQAVSREPDNPQFLFNLGSAEQFLGHEDAARAAYSAAIAHKPDFSRAHWAWSELEKNQPEPGRLEHLLALHERCSGSSDRLYLSHAISRAYEKLGDFDTAFTYLKNAKQQRRTEIQYSVETDLALFKAIRETFAASPPEPAASDVLDGRPLFIIGMPRSGTTLLERIVSSHSQAVSLGELQEFPHAVKRVAGTRSPLVLDPETVRAAADRNMSEIGSHYARALADRIPAGQQFIDKLPLNFLCVGFILAALPRAKIICLRRNALDTCLSNYRQLFALNFSYYNYHYDLADTARFYGAFHRLMEFWQALYPERFTQLYYEELVTDPEPSIRSTLQFLGLGWEPDCLAFHQQGGAVATASAPQVRQPLYNSAIARWKKYEKHLAPAMKVLDAEGIEYR
ncbi:MAG: sulfotransferase [Gammaproteobacteria bacterium]